MGEAYIIFQACLNLFQWNLRMSSPFNMMLDTKPLISFMDNSAPPENHVNSSNSCNSECSPQDPKIDLLPPVFAVVKVMEEKDNNKASASDVTNKLNQFHSNLKQIAGVDRFFNSRPEKQLKSNYQLRLWE